MKRIALSVFVVCLLPLSAIAEGTGPPPRLVEAIARQESGLNPLAVNVAGESYYPATRTEAEAIIQQAQAAGKSFDVGQMQINSWWMDRYNIPPASLLDPTVNRAWGEWILTQEIVRHGLNWRAVGRYHSPDEERGRRYTWLVYRHYAGHGALRTTTEVPNAQQTLDTQNVPDAGRVRHNPGIRPQGRIITFDLQQADLPGNARSKP